MREHRCVFGWGWWGGCWGKENQLAGPDKGGCGGKRYPLQTDLLVLNLREAVVASVAAEGQVLDQEGGGLGMFQDGAKQLAQG